MNTAIQTLATVVIAIVALLYLLSIVYVIKDARHRGARWQLWGIVSLIPFIGLIIWCVARPQLTAEDRDEQDLEIALKRRQLMKFGECPHCGYPIETDYVLCPHCHTRLKNLCPTCRHALNPEWAICPYCTTQIHSGAPAPQGQGVQRRRAAADATNAHRRVG